MEFEQGFGQRQVDADPIRAGEGDRRQVDGPDIFRLIRKRCGLPPHLVGAGMR